MPPSGSGRRVRELRAGQAERAAPAVARPARIEYAEARDHAEEDRQELAAPAPVLVAEDQHRGEGEQPVGADRPGEPRRDRRAPDRSARTRRSRRTERAPASSRSHVGSRSGGSPAAAEQRHGQPPRPVPRVDPAPRDCRTAPCTSVSPTHSSVQTISGSGLDSGSRLPRKPAATSIAKHGEGSEAGRQPQRLAARCRAAAAPRPAVRSARRLAERSARESSRPPRARRRRDSSPVGSSST